MLIKFFQKKTRGQEKMEMVCLNVLEVVQLKSRNANPTSNGIERNVIYARLQTEGAFYEVLVHDGVEVPLHWKGKAYCSGQSVSFTTVYQNQGRSRNAVVPFEILKFIPIAEVKKDNLVQEFFGASSSSASPLPGKGNSN